jgi:hypothetical protein
VNTQKTFHKQSGTFLSAIAANIPPELSSGQMQYFIEKPGELRNRLAVLFPTFRELVGRMNGVEVEFFRLHPVWDFIIMRSSLYPELGIAVSDHSEICGNGIPLAVWDGGEYENFFAPNIRSHKWASQLAVCRLNREKEFETDILKSCTIDGLEMIRKRCGAEGIKLLVMRGFDWYQGNGGLKFIDLFDPGQVEDLDEQKFKRAFEWLYTWEDFNTDNTICSLHAASYRI